MSGNTGLPPLRTTDIMTGDAFVGAHRPPEWLVQGIIQRSRLYSCTSLTAHGKTAVALYVACMVHVGRPVGKLRTRKGNVLYLAGENPQDLEARMLGTARHFRIPSLELPYVLPATFPLNEDEVIHLQDDIAKLGVDFALIIGDTAASFFAGDDENDNVQAGEQGRLWRRLTQVNGHPAVMPLCHPVKNASKDNLLPRGGGAFLNELDGNLTLWSQAVGELTSLHWQGKIRGPDFAALDFRLFPISTGLQDSHGNDEMTIVAVAIDETEATSQHQQAVANEDAVLLALHEHPDMSQVDIADQLGWRDGRGDPERHRVNRCIRALAKDKLVKQERARGNWTVTTAGKAALQHRYPHKSIL